MFDKNGSLRVHNKREVNLPCGALIQSLCKAYSYELKEKVAWGGPGGAVRPSCCSAAESRAALEEPEASGGINNQILL